MNSGKLKVLSNGYFSLILASGLLYTILLLIASVKILPGFVMQIIFLLDAIKLKDNLYALTLSKSFLINTSFCLALVLLVVRYLKAAINTLRSVGKTSSFINTLAVKRITPRYISYFSPDNLIFTIGLIKPKIYLSASLFQSHTKEEIEAMLLHEENHQKNHDPLKVFVTGFIDAVFPGFPGKSWLINHYLTLTEITSDQFSIDLLHNKRPLISALFKLQQNFFSPFSATAVNYFNSQSERIKILTGHQKQNFKRPLVFHSMILATILVAILFTKNTTIFFKCTHLLSCFKALTTSTDQSLLTTIHCDIPPVTLVNHCQ